MHRRPARGTQPPGPALPPAPLDHAVQPHRRRRPPLPQPLHRRQRPRRPPGALPAPPRGQRRGPPAPARQGEPRRHGRDQGGAPCEGATVEPDPGVRGGCGREETCSGGGHWPAPRRVCRGGGVLLPLGQEVSMRGRERRVHGARGARCPPVGVRYLADKTADPSFVFITDVSGFLDCISMKQYREKIPELNLVPLARPCTLQEYLVCCAGLLGGLND
uniref:Uncharacterized protein n=1 Tax=Aegilops tauschii subsp. strangulata TaxID=200361 RepID=A0A453AL88_AEGTS